jgi:hypothetical protein
VEDVVSAPTLRLPVHPDADRSYAVGLGAVVGSLLVLPLLAGPWAWYLGVAARREMLREPGRWSGQRRALAGVVLGASATALLGLLVLVLVGWAVREQLALVADSGY